MDKKRISRIFFFEGLTCGLFIATLIAIIFPVIEALLQGTDWWSQEAVLLFPITLAAYFTLKGVAEQARSAQDIDTERLERAERAKKAKLTNALCLLDEHAKHMLTWHHSPRQHYTVDWQPISNALEVLSDVIEFSDRVTGDQLASVVAMQQISRSRYSEHQFELDQDIVFALTDLHFNNHFHCDCTIRWAALKRGVSACFKYARYDSPQITEVALRRDEVVSEICQAHPTRELFDLEDTEFDLLNDVLDKIFKNGTVLLERFHKRKDLPA